MMLTAGSKPRAPRRWGRGATSTATALLVALAATLAVTVAPAPVGAATQSGTNAAAIAIPGVQSPSTPDHSPGAPYPSPITISGLTGTTTKVTVTLNNLSHGNMRDVEVLLVGPAGQKMVVMADVGGNTNTANVSPTFADEATTSAPDGPLATGTYKPTNYSNGFTGDLWPAPAPAGPYATTFAAFNGTDPNGTWNLYVADDASGDLGSMAGGWTLSVETGVATFPGSFQLHQVETRVTEGQAVATVQIDRVSGDDGAVGVTFATGTGSATAGDDYTAVNTTVAFADGQTTRTVDIPITNDALVEGADELVPITLSAPTGGATLGTPTAGQIRIQDNDARANAFPITVPASGPTLGAADPYPSNIVVAGAAGVVTDVDVNLNDVSHTHIRDLDVLLVAPNGATTMLMQDVGPNTPVSALELTFSDEAAAGITQAGLTSGTYKPSQFDDEIPEALPAPAPAGPFGTTLAALDGTSPNGTWSLYVVDDAGGDIGDIGGGWSLTLETATASAGGPYSAAEGADVALSGSTTPSLTGATYEWDVDGDGQYDDATGLTPTVTAATLASIGLGDGPDSSTVRLRVTSGSAVITSTATTLTITNAAPTATFSNDGPVALGETADVTFTGQADTASADTTAGFRYSYDLDDDGDWEVGDGTYVGGSTSASATVPTSALDALGTHEVNGRIIDKDGGFTDYTTTITVTAPPNAAPVAVAGPDQTVNPGDTVTLDGTGSTDADGDTLTYAWDQTAGTAVTLSDATAAEPTFTAPTGPTTLTFELTADDGEGGSDTDTVTITVNGAPTADAGPDQTVDQGDTVTLDGTASADPDTGDTIDHAWVQTGGTTVTLTGADTAEPTFTAPDGPATLTFELTVTDGMGLTDTDTVSITVNEPPSADAGPDQTVDEGDTVTLDGTDSTDAEGAITYAWAQTGGTAVTLSDATVAEPTFTAPAGAATLTFELTVTDEDGAADTDTVTIMVNGPPVADAGPDQDVVEGDTVTLDGTGSTDAEGDLTHAWTQTGGTTVTLTGADTAEPTFTAPSSGGTLTFELTVTDERDRTDADTVSVVVDRRPTADAGPDQDVNAGDTVTLDGTDSTDPDGDTLTYAWDQISGTTVALTGATTANPTFTAPTGPAVLTFRLVVDDGRGGEDPDVVTVVVNGIPVADAGPDQDVVGGDPVTLDGTDSSDPDGDTLTYAWDQTAGTSVTLSDATAVEPTFTAPTGPTTLTFELTADDGNGETDTDTVTITVNGIPTADAGPDQLVNGGDTVTLDGTDSTDPDGDTLTYSWDQTAGTAVTLTGATTANPTFTAPTGPATLTFELTVDDGDESDTDTVTVTVNGVPSADAGDDQLVNGGDAVTLDATDSSDPDGDTLTYAWDQTAGTSVTLSDATAAQPTFTAPTGPATLTFELTVDDGRDGTDTDTVTITVNGIPTADAGPDQLVNGGDTVTLDGTDSVDPDGDTLTYTWDQTAGTTVTLSDATAAQPTFTAPTGPATLTFELTVDDGNGETDTDTVTITVNGPPTADAGPDQDTNLGDTVTLDGTDSVDPDGDTLTYSWGQTGGGTVVTLTGATTAQPTFTAPEGSDTLAFELTVDDGNGETDTDAVIITVNGPPTADAGDDQAASLGDTVTLDGTGSSDPDGDTLTYAWTQTAGPPVILAGATTPQPTFVAPAGPATAIFELTVDDGNGRSDTDEVSVSFNGAPIANAGEDQDVNRGDTVTLDGTGSSDPEDDDLTSSWTQTGGPTVTLTGATTPEPTFTAPEGPATLTFELTVTDEDGLASTDEVTVTVNGPPAADAGPDQLVDRDDTVTLDGTGSVDPDDDPLAYAWEQDSGPDVTLSDPTTSAPTFTAPEGPAVLVFTLTVDDGEGRTDTDTVTITVNGPPTADAGDDEDVVERTEATLDGTASSDPDGDDLTYAWTQTSSPTVTLAGGTTATATFAVPDAPASLAFELTVTDERGRTSTDSVVLTALPRFTPDEAFVEHTFQVLLGRDAEPAGRAYFAARLADGTTRTEVARLIGFSAEATRGRVLDQRYQAWLGRPADASARSFWAPRLQGGQPIVDLERSILASGELYQRAGGTNPGYVIELFELLLGRTPNATDLGFWSARVSSKGRSVVVSEILGSNEAERRRVATAYVEMLGRPADPGGLTYWTGVLDATRDLRRVEVRLAAAWVNQPGSSV